MKNNIPICLILLILLVSACKKKSNDTIHPTDKEFVSFQFKAGLNPDLTNTVEGQIIDSLIVLEISQTINNEALIASFEFKGKAVFIGTAEQKSGVTINDFSQPIDYIIHAKDNSTKKYTVIVKRSDDLKTVLPHIFIEVEDGAEIVEKDTYLHATITIDGKGSYEDYTGLTQIKGRGNTSWYLPKKPYRLKLHVKAPLLGLPAYKDWVLLAEYLDGSMLYNSVPFKAARQLGIPYTNHIIPVELTINNVYKGVYAFTEHKEVGVGRIDIGKNGLLLELDNNYDEDWKFQSNYFGLPVMIQYPKSKDMNNERLAAIRADFETFESLVFDDSFPDNNYLDYIDDQAFVDYLIVYELTLNQEINHPKSTYINKLAGGKYRMGIIWDFDWAYGFKPETGHYYEQTATWPLFVDISYPGTLFFKRLMEAPHMQQLFKERWNWFITYKYRELKEYVRVYAYTIQPALANDHDLWGPRGSTGNTEQDLQKILNWLEARKNFIDSNINNF
ncbi:MAG: CotH kinase family protein [Bacteroidales bacterium]|jgi:hypothetical protein|nr:CotH kinase family protein [Bacteroidales bacterium]MDD3700263.1 CotH kinase family protein [Bacteroidales bacterium]MDY0368493.1 CotH kinase family protein [Bacteroidales bacterium]